MKAVDVIQRSDSWYEVRRGMPTCSRFDQILTPVQAKPAAAQETLINELLAESIMPPEIGVTKNFISDEMQSGMILEAEARCAYELEFAELPVSEVGFLVADNGLYGGSPDALVGDVGGVEIKCPAAATHIGYYRAGKLPNEYRCQVHGYLIVTQRSWWDFFSYCRNLPPFRIRVTRDDFTVQLEAELLRFCEKYRKAREQFGIMDLKAAREASISNGAQ